MLMARILEMYRAIIYLSLLMALVRGKDNSLCVVKTPLETPYLTSVIETPGECKGCLFQNTRPANSPIEQVHIIHLTDPPNGRVYLDLKLFKQDASDEIPSSVAIVLSSDVPVQYYIYQHHAIDKTNFTFIINPGDEIHGKRKQWKIQPKPISLGNELLIDEAMALFKFISSYSKSQKANHVSLILRQGVSHSTKCDLLVDEISPVTECEILEKQDLVGCFDYENLGATEKGDIHILEINGNNKRNNSIKLEVAGVSNSDRYFNEISAFRRYDYLDISNPVKRNLTLVLVTSQATTWQLLTSNLQGTITVLVGNVTEVENKSSSGSGLSIQVKQIDLPATLDQLFLKVLSNFGAPVSYSRTSSPSRVTLTVPNNIKDDPPQENILEILKKHLIINCLPNKIDISLIQEILDYRNGVTLYLSDCPFKSNYTHLYLESKYQECGFRPIPQYYKNYIQASVGTPYSDDEDFEGSGWGSDTNYNSKIDPLFIKCPRVEEPKVNKSNGAKYSLKLFEHSDRISSLKAFKLNRWIYATVDLISVSDSISAYNPDLRVMLEKCWLSNSSDLRDGNARHHNLIEKACPSRQLVNISWSSSPNFQFQPLSEDFMFSNIYLHCMLGVCSRNLLPRPAVNKCITPEKYCSNQPLVSSFEKQPSSSAITVITLGPYSMTIAPVEFPTYEEGKKAAQVIIVGGLSTEVVVGIAIASFVIGVCLTGSLWVIYMRTDPRRQRASETGVPRNSGYDLSAHSGSSTPSSQAPIRA